MKRILKILLVSAILIGCNDNRVLLSDLSNKGSYYNHEMYYEGKLFTGTSYQFHYESSEIANEQEYINGKRNGLMMRWHQNGQLYVQGFYKDDKLDSLYSTWYESGEISREMNFKDGKKTELAKYYNIDGSINLRGLMTPSLEDYETDSELIYDPCHLLEAGIIIMREAQKLRIESDFAKNGGRNLTEKQRHIIENIEDAWFGDLGFERQLNMNRWNPNRSPMRWCENLEEFSRLRKISLASPDF